MSRSEYPEVEPAGFARSASGDPTTWGQGAWTPATEPLDQQRSKLMEALLGGLRRHWHLAVAASAVAATLGLAAGWRLGKITYTSTATVHVKPMLQRVMYGDEEKGPLPMYDSYVNTQVSLLTNRRTEDMAIADPRWEEAYGSPTQSKIAAFQNAITVSRQGELVMVAVSNESPGVAQIGANTLVSSFKKIYMEQGTQQDEQRLAALQNKQTSLASEIAAVRQKITAAANQYGSEDLEPIYKAKLELVSALELEIQRKKVAATRPVVDAVASGTMLEEAERAALHDARLNSLLTRRDEANSRYLQLHSKLGDDNTQVVAAQKELLQVDEDIARRVSELKASGQLSGLASGEGMPTEQLPELEKMLEKSRDDLLTLGRQSLQIKELRLDEKRLRDDLDQVRRRLDQLMMEGTTAGRLEVISDGDLPATSSKDTRLRNAALGGLGAGGLTLLMVAALGMLDRRVREIEDAQARTGRNTPILGILPEVPDGLEDPEVAAQAAHNVHQIRTLLEVWAGQRTPISLAVTSPSSGSGKTSLTLALGVSFAAAGMKTLLIDLDVIGGGLSARTESMSRRKLGAMLVTTGVITDAQREEALSVANIAERRLGEVCVELGYATEAQIKAALQEQAGPDERPGLIDALGGESIERCARPTEVPGLSVLPIGRAELAHAGSISPVLVRRLLKLAGSSFEVILVDSGPSPGSIEAGAAVISADGVILAVSRGDQRSDVRDCTNYLDRIGARLAGVVFNRAGTRQVLRISTSRISVPARANASKTIMEITSENVRGVSAATQQMGPIASAVASHATGIALKGHK